ncbi:MAG: thioesterase [Deltaproteobacteria bacterium CG11_big_fil_rev_8_21_14_0_20_47_16]|nr:MAG: thioesterase [Deltaproteobacteria bacterium CG11_big_fil_rev_8_21_14_0_20_47_16]
MKFETVIPVRFGDLDCMGHVNNAVYFTYMEQARVEFCNQFPELDFRKPENRSGKSFILANISCDFKKPVEMDETLLVDIQIPRIGNSSFDIAYNIRLQSSGQTVAEGKSVQVYYDYTKASPVPLTALIKSQLERYAI